MSFDTSSKKKRSNKAKAEFEFDSSAAPVSLKSFFSDLLAPAPDQIDTTQELTGFEDHAPMIPMQMEYPSNSVELSPQLLELADNFLELSEKLSDEIPTTDQPPSDLNKQIVELTTMSMINDTPKETISLRVKTKNLSAKRFSFKALQLFSFNENYGKHFTMDSHELRKINSDMLIDTSAESVTWLNELGNYYKNSFLSDLGFANQQKEDQFLLNNLQNTTHFRALGFSVILKNCTLHHLVNPFIPLGEFDTFVKDTGYHNFNFIKILDYFGLKMFGLHKGLDFQLNYLHLIPYYIKRDSKKKIFTLFEDLDFKSVFF